MQGPEPEPAREPGLAPERVQAQEPALEPERAREPACWRPAVQPGPGHARRRFCQRHNTQQWPG